MKNEAFDYFYDSAKELLLKIANSMHDRCPLSDCSMNFNKNEVLVVADFLKNFIRKNYE